MSIIDLLKERELAIDLLKERKREKEREIAYRGFDYYGKHKYPGTCRFPKTVKSIMKISHYYDAAVYISKAYNIGYTEAEKILLYEMKVECEKRLTELEEQSPEETERDDEQAKEFETTFPIFDTSLDFEEE